MPVLSSMCERKSGRITEAARSAMYELGHHGERLYSTCTYAWHEKQLGEISGAPLDCRRERTVQSSRDHVARAHVMVGGHHEMRQQTLVRRPGVSRDRRQLRNDAIGIPLREQIELCVARCSGAPIGEVYDFAAPLA